MVTYTTTYSFAKPTVGDDEDVWGGYLNGNFDTLESLLKGTTALTAINVTGNITVGGTVDGVDIAARDAVLTSTTTTANAALPKAGGTMTGAITFAAGQTFDGRDVSADGAKLDGIETGATADQTKADIDALGINAATLDSLDSTQFLRSDTSDTMTGTLTVTGNVKAGDSNSDVTIGEHPSYAAYGAVWLDGESDYRLLFNPNSDTFINALGSGHIYFRNDNGTLVEIPDTGGLLVNGNGVWHSGNDGAGSGLDADTVDGYGTSTVQSTNTVAVRDGSGYLFAQYFNGNGTFSTSGASSGMVNFTGTNGSDTYGRSYNGTAARAAMGLSTTSGVAFGSVTGTSYVYSPGYIQAPTMYLNGAMYHTGDTNTYIQFHAADQWRVVTGGSERLEVNNTRTWIDRLFVDAGVVEDYEALSGTSPTCNVNNGGAFSLTMTGNTTFTFTAPWDTNDSTGFILELTGNGSTVTWPSSVDWAGGTAPDAPASGETDIYVFWTRDGGTTWYGVQSIDAAA